MNFDRSHYVEDINAGMKDQEVILGGWVEDLRKMGKMTFIDVIYPHQKFVGEKVNRERVKEAFLKVMAIIKKFNIDIIAIGNGTASRETESFIAAVIKKVEDRKINFIIVNEAGASVYSASELAKEEFPKLDSLDR